MNLSDVAQVKSWFTALAAVSIVLALAFAPNLQVTAQTQLTPEFSPEYNRYVHSSGGKTVIDKPVFPVFFSNSTILVGQKWSITVPLVADHSYHVYCYGEWINTSSTAKTDYDIYVYNPQGALESLHTEAAGLPEHLGTKVNDAFFVPEHTGDYTFVLANDAGQSSDAQQATFMVIENVETNEWTTHYSEGKSENNQPGLHTAWAYEFVTDSPDIEVWIKVPDTLDMYEARLYVMNDSLSPTINGVPLPWEPGLYGNISIDIGVGGYNFESEQYRGVAYASCEFKGQDMYLDYSATSETVSGVVTAAGKTLYHLVLIGEVGSGNIEFIVKTRFGDATLTPLSVPRRVTPTNETAIRYQSNSSALEEATLQYTVDGWGNTSTLDMEIDNKTCSAVIPQQEAGTLVEYTVQTIDELKNNLTATGNFTVKYAPKLNITLPRDTIRIGENITVNGTLNLNFDLDLGENDSLPLTVEFLGANETKQVRCTILEDGTFTASFRPETEGYWTVQATMHETETTYKIQSSILLVKVIEQTFFVKNAVYIGGGLIGIIAASAAISVIRSRRA